MDNLYNFLKVLLGVFGYTVYEGGSSDALGCVFPSWGCEE